jgi:signal transduction histidine kinase
MLPAEELRRANEQLLLSSLREQASAEEARAAKRELEQVLRRMSLLADASALLSASLQSSVILGSITKLIVAELADCSVIQLIKDGAVEQLEVAHKDPRLAEQLSRLGVGLAQDVELRRMLKLALSSRHPQLIEPSSEPSAHETFLRKSGSYAYLSIPLDARGQLLGVLTMARADAVSGYSPMEVQLAVELGRRVSIAVDNAQLYDDAQQAIQLREDVLAIVSHDLRNPLGAITLGAQRLLESDELESLEKARSSLERILRSAKHMRSLTDELLEVASIHTGQLRLNREVADMAALLDDTLAMLEPSAHKKKITLGKTLTTQSMFVSCDREKIMRVVANLLNNAVKFTPVKGRIDVLAELVGKEIRVHVRDTGPGIANADQASLFERYWKGASAGRGGMGLGLYIARGIVEAHGGQLSVTSDLGNGSTFTFSLPINASAVERDL